MPCEANFPTTLNGDCLSVALGAFTGQTSFQDAYGAAYHLVGYFSGLYSGNRLPSVDDATEAQFAKLEQAIETAPQGLIFDRPPDSAAPVGAFDWATLLKLLLPILLDLLRRRRGGG